MKQNTSRRCIAPHACPCGYSGDPVKACTCSPGIVTEYQKRISAHWRAMQARSARTPPFAGSMVAWKGCQEWGDIPPGKRINIAQFPSSKR